MEIGDTRGGARLDPEIPLLQECILVFKSNDEEAESAVDRMRRLLRPARRVRQVIDSLHSYRLNHFFGLAHQNMQYSERQGCPRQVVGLID